MALRWKGLTYTAEGRLQITLHETRGGAPYNAHFLETPRNLETDDDIAPVPKEYVELVVALTCKRLSESAGNATVAQYYFAECDRLWRYVKRNVLIHDRMRQESLDPVGGFDSVRNGVAEPWTWRL